GLQVDAGLGGAEFGSTGRHGAESFFDVGQHVVEGCRLGRDVAGRVACDTGQIGNAQVEDALGRGRSVLVERAGAGIGSGRVAVDQAGFAEIDVDRAGGDGAGVIAVVGGDDVQLGGS